MEYLSRMNKEDFPTSHDEVLETLIELINKRHSLDGTKTSNKLSSVLSTSEEESEKGPKIINFTDGSHGFARPDGFYEAFVIDAKGKFIKNKKSASKDNSSDKDKTAKDKDTKTSKSVFFSMSSAPAAADPDSEDESYEP